MEKLLALTINIMMIMIMMTTMNRMMTLNVLSNNDYNDDDNDEPDDDFERTLQYLLEWQLWQVSTASWRFSKTNCEMDFEREKLICIWWTFFYVAENISIIMQI